MNRRAILSLLGGAAAWPLAARSAVVGFLDARSPQTVRKRLRGFRQGLRDNGYATVLIQAQRLHRW